MTTQVSLYIDGQWSAAASGRTLPFWNPATRDVIGEVAAAGTQDLDRALDAAAAGFKVWRKVSAFDRYRVLRKAGDLPREEGKTLAEARGEVLAGGDIIDWLAEEGGRTYGA